MPYDGIFTNNIVNELKTLENCKVEKIHQPSKDEIIVFFKKDRKNVKVLFCINPQFPRVHITEQSRENPAISPSFCMSLRKHIGGGRLIEVSQINLDRIVEFKVEGSDELGYPVIYYLIIEIMGKHSNIILLNSDKMIIDCIKHVGSSMNRYREVLPGVLYVMPPQGGKVNILDLSEKEIKSILSNKPEMTALKSVTSSFTGFSTTFAREITRGFSEIKVCELSSQQKEIILSNLLYYIAKIKSADYKNIVFYKDSSMIDYYVFPLFEYSQLKSECYQSSGKLLDDYYSLKDLLDTLKQKYSSLFKLVSNLIERNSKKIQIYEDKIRECSSYNAWKVYGDLIMANQYNITSGSDKAVLQNFYDDDFKEIEIPLDVDLNAVQNAQKYYKKYNKEKSTIQNVKKQLEDTIEDGNYLESTLYNIENASETETIEEIKAELCEMGYIKKRKLKGKIKSSEPHHFVSSDNYDIYVGKNNRQNDYLTTKFAVGSDIWMHTKKIPGSHVIIKSQNGSVSDAALLEGALLASYYSKAKNSANVPVDYTEKKNVKKPQGSKPGMVVYVTNRTIYVTPDAAKIEKLKHVN